MKINGKTNLLGVFGNPIEHTKSPSLHNPWIVEENLNAVYVPLHINDIEVAVKAIKAMNIVGVNVTIPFKEDVIPFLDDVSEEAKLIGAVNTIANIDGKLIGYNTDVIGIENSLGKELLNSTKTALILGAGGASKAAAFEMKKFNIKTDVLNRTESKAETLVNTFNLNKTVTEQNVYENQYDLIINTTSVGMDDASSPLDLELFSIKPNVVYDIIYIPEKTPLLKQAESLGINILNGFSMLEHQAKAAFNIWKPFICKF